MWWHLINVKNDYDLGQGSAVNWSIKYLDEGEKIVQLVYSRY
jgi:predicted secreted protein